MAKTYSILTYGCQMNESDSERIGGLLQRQGYAQADSVETSDLILLNTCSVRDSAAQTVFGKLGEFKIMKKNRENLIVGVTGCLAESDAAYMAKRAPHVDFFLGTRKLHLLPEALDRLSEQSLLAELAVPVAPEALIRRPLIWIGDDELDEKALDHFVPRDHPFKAWVPIMRGCSYYCTFCIVPLVRGGQVSRESTAILQEIRGLVDRGYKEVVLLGQTVDAYGRDRVNDLSFSGLLQAVDQVPGIERIRYTSPHPKDMTRETIQVIADSRHICEHFHLPVQSGSNRILERMRRGYTRERYLSLVEEIRSLVPHGSFSTDLIAGFPGETNEDIEETISLVRAVQFDTGFTFQYSSRPGTAASKLPDQISPEVKTERLIRMNKALGECALARNQAVVGKIDEVLVEGPSAKNSHRLNGRTRTNRLVNFDGPQDLIGKLVPVKMNSARSWSLDGEIQTPQV